MENKQNITELYLNQDSAVIESAEYFGCPNLRSVHLGANVKLVRQGAFASCPQLEYIECSDETIFEDYCFNNDYKINTLKYGSNEFKLWFFPVSCSYYMGLLSTKIQNESIYVGNFINRNKIGQVPEKSQDIVYLATVTIRGQEYSWFSNTPTIAMIGARYKASKKSFNDYFQQTITLETPISWGQLQLLIGVCGSGVKLWGFLAHKCGYKVDDAIPLKTILKMVKNTFPGIYDRLNQAYLHQHEYFNWLNYDTLYSDQLFKKELNLFIKNNQGLGDNNESY